METKKSVLVVIMALAVVLVIFAAFGSAETDAAPCEGNCGNQNCAAAQGGACDCESCPVLACASGDCQGDCPNAECGAKVGLSCGCGQ